MCAFCLMNKNASTQVLSQLDVMQEIPTGISICTKKKVMYVWIIIITLIKLKIHSWIQQMCNIFLFSTRGYFVNEIDQTCTHSPKLLDKKRFLFHLKSLAVFYKWIIIQQILKNLSCVLILLYLPGNLHYNTND